MIDPPGPLRLFPQSGHLASFFGAAIVSILSVVKSLSERIAGEPPERAGRV
jgi:hypothetical protein